MADREQGRCEAGRRPTSGWARSVASASRRSVCFRPAVEPMTAVLEIETPERGAAIAIEAMPRPRDRASGNCERSTNAGKIRGLFRGTSVPNDAVSFRKVPILGRGLSARPMKAQFRGLSVLDFGPPHSRNRWRCICPAKIYLTSMHAGNAREMGLSRGLAGKRTEQKGTDRWQVPHSAPKVQHKSQNCS